MGDGEEQAIAEWLAQFPDPNGEVSALKGVDVARLIDRLIVEARSYFETGIDNVG